MFSSYHVNSPCLHYHTPLHLQDYLKYKISCSSNSCCSCDGELRVRFEFELGPRRSANRCLSKQTLVTSCVIQDLI